MLKVEPSYKNCHIDIQRVAQLLKQSGSF